MQKLFMFMLAAVSNWLQFGKNGGVFGWFTDRFSARQADGTTLANIEAAEATEGSHVVTLSQLNSNLAKTKGAIIVSGAINAITDVPGQEGEVRISSITEGSFTEGVLYIGVDNDGSLEWQEISLVDGQLATFGTTQELPDGSGGFIYQYHDTHVYIWDETSGQFLDHGEIMMSEGLKIQRVSFNTGTVYFDKTKCCDNLYRARIDIEVPYTTEPTTFKLELDTDEGETIDLLDHIDFTQVGANHIDIEVQSVTADCRLISDGGVGGSGRAHLEYF